MDCECFAGFCPLKAFLVLLKQDACRSQLATLFATYTMMTDYRICNEISNNRRLLQHSMKIRVKKSKFIIRLPGIFDHHILKNWTSHFLFFCSKTEELVQFLSYNYLISLTKGSSAHFHCKRYAYLCAVHDFAPFSGNVSTLIIQLGTIELIKKLFYFQTKKELSLYLNFQQKYRLEHFCTFRFFHRTIALKTFN